MHRALIHNEETVNSSQPTTGLPIKATWQQIQVMFLPVEAELLDIC